MSAVFVSHSTIDDHLIDQLTEWLRSGHYADVFVDHKHIHGGDTWADVLAQKNKDCRVVLLFLTQNWLASDECYAEYAAAMALKKRVMPVFLVNENELSRTEADRFAKVRDKHHGVDLTPIYAFDKLDFTRSDPTVEALHRGLRASGAFEPHGQTRSAVAAAMETAFLAAFFALLFFASEFNVSKGKIGDSFAAQAKLADIVLKSTGIGAVSDKGFIESYELACLKQSPNDSSYALDPYAASLSIAAIEMYNRPTWIRIAENAYADLILSLSGTLPDVTLGPMQISPVTARKQLASSGEAQVTDPELFGYLADECANVRLGKAIVTQIVATCGNSGHSSFECIAKKYNGSSGSDASFSYDQVLSKVYHTITQDVSSSAGQKKPLIRLSAVYQPRMSVPLESGIQERVSQALAEGRALGGDIHLEIEVLDDGIGPTALRKDLRNRRAATFERWFRNAKPFINQRAPTVREKQQGVGAIITVRKEN